MYRYVTSECECLSEWFLYLDAVESGMKTTEDIESCTYLYCSIIQWGPDRVISLYIDFYRVHYAIYM